MSHYLFEARFGRPGKGNDKGIVEGQVGYARRNFMVPIPRAAGFEELNEQLPKKCRERRNRRLRGHKQTIAERFERDRSAFLPLPPVPYEAFAEDSSTVSSTSLVRFMSNDYSVPVACGYRDVLVKGYVHEVAIVCGNKEIARHDRCYDKEDVVFDPMHYLPLLERKAGALDQAAPLR